MTSIPRRRMVVKPTSRRPYNTPAARAGRKEAQRSLIGRLSTDTLTWAIYGVAFVSLCILVTLREHLLPATDHALLAFFFGLATLATLMPASGPRGQRFSLLPGVGLAGMLLLPPLPAALPLLLAAALHATTRDTAAGRRMALAHGLTLAAAAGIGSSALGASWGGFAERAVLATILYSAVAIGGLAFLNLVMRRRTGAEAQLEAAGLLASVPAAGLMSLAWAPFHVAGVAAAAGLMALLLVIAHYGFEVSGLRDQVRAMEKLSAVALSQTTPGRVIERFLQLTGGLIPYDRASLWLTDDSQTRLERIASRQSAAVRQEVPALDGVAAVRFGEGLVGRVADRQSHLLVRDGSRDPRAAQAEERAGTSKLPYSVLLLPLVAGGETVGVAQFERDAAGGYSSRDVSRVSALASQAAATIANVRMHRDIYNQSITDGLTNLFNRRHMQAALVDERQRAVRYGHSLSVIMLDVDGFKSYNDTYGHPQGDVLLKLLAGLLRENVREVDIVGRYGGEEFIVLMPETSKAEALRTAERLRTAVATTVFPGFPDDPEMAVFKTISLGVATFPQDAEEMPTLVQMADQALYRAKRGGRNQVVSALSQAEEAPAPVEK